MPPEVLQAWRTGHFPSGWWNQLDADWVVYALNCCRRDEVRSRHHPEYRRTEALLVELIWSPFAELALTTVDQLWANRTRAPERPSIALLSAISAYRAGQTAAAIKTLEPLQVEGRALTLKKIVGFLCLWQGKRARPPKRTFAQRFPQQEAGLGYYGTPPIFRPDLLRAHLWLAKFAPEPIPDARAISWTGARAVDLRAAAAALAHTDFPSALHLASQAASRRARSKAFVAVGKVAMKNWRLLDALNAADAALKSWRSSAKAHALKAMIFQLLGDRTSAVLSAQAALALDPLNSDAARVVQILLPQALSIDLDTVTSEARRSPQPLVATHQGAIMLVRAGNILGAETLLKNALKNSSADGAALAPLQHYLAHCAELREEYRTALTRFALIDARNPAYLYIRHIGLARCHLELGNATAAEDEIKKAEAHDLSAGLPKRFENVRMELRLLQGRIGEAYGEYRNRRVTHQFLDTFGKKYLRVEETLSSKTEAKSGFVFPEGGPGDEIRLTSLLDDIRTVVPSLTVACEPRLYTIFSRSFPSIEFVPVPRSRREFRSLDYFSRRSVRGALAADSLNDTAVGLGKRADVALSYLDVLGELRPDRDAFPQRKAYLRADPVRVDRWKDFLQRESSAAGSLRVALTWRSMLTSVQRDRHYLTVSHLKALGDLPGIEFWVTQTGITLAEVAEIKAVLPNVHFPYGLDLRDDFEEQAAFFANMDLSIAPCTTHAEFAAALGCRTLFLSNMASTLWRRNTDGRDVWHASARQVCGDRLGDRVSLVENIVQQIADFSEEIRAS
ncbi:hypothetical protein ASF81_07120 [Brevundimonas sp. Leaf168]|nr:hypothetical protein ASF81_07120 [Brevundimonas sp. Leaf168]